MSRKISPVAAAQGKPIGMRCTCDRYLTGEVKAVRPTCPVHGHGRPAGRLKEN